MTRNNTRRRQDRAQSAQPPSPTRWPVIEHPQYAPNEAALRLILADLTEDPALRTNRLSRDLYGLLEGSGITTLFGVIGYLLTQVVDGLERGHGSTAKAIDAVLDELATAAPQTPPSPSGKD